MKNEININQSKIVAYKLITRTDFTDWAIMDYLKDLLFKEDSKSIEYEKETYVRINYNRLMEELPFIKIHNKNVLSARFKKLKKLNLIKTWQDKDSTLYFTFTERGIDLTFKEGKVWKQIIMNLK